MCHRYYISADFNWYYVNIGYKLSNKLKLAKSRPKRLSATIRAKERRIQVIVLMRSVFTIHMELDDRTTVVACQWLRSNRSTDQNYVGIRLAAPIYALPVTVCIDAGNTQTPLKVSELANFVLTVACSPRERSWTIGWWRFWHQYGDPRDRRTECRGFKWDSWRGSTWRWLLCGLSYLFISTH